MEYSVAYSNLQAIVFGGAECALGFKILLILRAKNDENSPYWR